MERFWCCVACGVVVDAVRLGIESLNPFERTTYDDHFTLMAYIVALRSTCMEPQNITAIATLS